MKKLTKILILIGVAFYIIYDIIALIKGGNEATESNIILTWIWTMPFISYTIAVLIGHFFSLIKLWYKRYKYLWLLISISAIILILSIITYKINFFVHPSISFVIGFLTGTFTWGQRSKYE